MGYDPATMVERGVLWAEDQDPFGHVMQAQFMHFLGTCFHRVMESYAEYMSEDEYNDMVTAKSVIPVVRRYELDIRRQVKYPDTVSRCGIHPCRGDQHKTDVKQLIAAYREDGIEPTRNHGTTSLFSLKQQAIVAEVKGSTTYVDVKSGRPVDIRTLGGGWANVFDAFTKKAETSKKIKAKWDCEHPPKSRRGEGSPKL